MYDEEDYPNEAEQFTNVGTRVASTGAAAFTRAQPGTVDGLLLPRSVAPTQSHSRASVPPPLNVPRVGQTSSSPMILEPSDGVGLALVRHQSPASLSAAPASLTVSPLPVIALSDHIGFVCTEPPPTPTLDHEVDSIRDYSVVVSHATILLAGDEICERWIQWPSTYPQEHILKSAYSLFGFPPNQNGTLPVSVPGDDIDQRERGFIEKTLFVYYRFVHEALIDPDCTKSTLGQKFVRVLETINNMAALIKLNQRTKLVTNDHFHLGTSSAVHTWSNALSAVPGDREETSFQKLLLFLLKRVYTLNLRKYNDKLYQQTVVDVPGVLPYRTHAWKVFSEIEDFVYSAVTKEKDYDMWLNLTSAHTNVSAASNYLKLCRDFELPRLVPDRHVFSFRNGVYDADQNIVYAYDDPHSQLPPSLVAAKFFNIDFPIDLVDHLLVNWRDIPTTKLDQILDHQKIPDQTYVVTKRVRTVDAAGKEHVEDVPVVDAPLLSVKHWYYVFIGRMIYEIGEYDEWQVLLFIKGVAGSGKSTLGKIVSYLYDANDVGVLSNNIEHKFGLAALVDKLIYVCYEVKHDFGLDQGEFQCMVSGEQMAIPKKFETATSVAWKTHGMFMGNEIASWCDNSGSMSRRIILGLFNEIVTDGNPKLFAELQAEMGHILLKCNRAYREAAAAFGSLDVWNVLPPYFAENRRKLRAETHALAFFLENCTDLHWDKKAYMSMDDIKLMMNVYLIADGSFKSQKRGFTSDFYQWVFDAYKIKVETDTRNYKGEVRTTNFITGVCDKNNQHFI
jgi:hypothetical protein